MSDDLLKDPLPEPWTFGVTRDGRVFFINDDDHTTTWLHPDTGQPAMTGYQRTIDLPSGWERGFAPDGPAYYINHNDRTTTFVHPNEAEQHQDNDSTLKKKKRRPSFTETLSRPLFRRSSSKNHKTRVEKMEPKEKRPSSARRSSQSLHKALKMTVMRRDPSSLVAKSGWLYKQDNSGMGGMKMWRKRWFVLSDFCLFYYKDPKEEEALGSIVLPSYDISTVNPDDKINRKYAFKIEHQGMRTYYISAESYKEMAEWVSILTNTCLVQSPSKSSPRKSHQSKDDVKKQADQKNQDSNNDDSEFGFNEVRPPPSSRSEEPPTPPSSHPSTPSSANHRPARNGNNNSSNNPKRSTSSSASQDASLPRQQSRNSQHSRSSRRTTSSSSRTHNSGGEPRRRGASEPPQSRNHHQHQQQYPPTQHHHQHPQQAPHPHYHQQQHPADPRLIKSYDQAAAYAQHNGEPPRYVDMSPPESRRTTGTGGGTKVKRHDSMAKLGSWVMNQKQQQQRQAPSNTTDRQRRPAYDTASELSSASSPNRNKAGYFYQPPPNNSHRSSARAPHAPSSGKRYKPGSYNDYMDPTEVASSIMSVPPMYRNNRVMSLPRPRSTQDLDERSSSRRRRIQNSKSTSYLEPQSPVARQPPGGARTKSDAHLPLNGAGVPVQRDYRPSSQKTPSSINTPRRPTDDVFSPVSPYDDRFRFDASPPARDEPHNHQGSKRSSGYEIKQMDVQGKQGQLRAFAVSMKQPDVIPSKPPQDVIMDDDALNNNESDIEAKLRRLNELDNMLQSLTVDISSLQTKKMRLERSLLRTKTSLSGEGSAIELEGKLSAVKAQLHESASKLKDMTKENEAFEKEIRKMKIKLLEQLHQGQPKSVSPNSSKESQRQLEWELGKVQLMMENLNRNKIGLVNKLENFKDDDESLASPTSTVGRSGSNKSSELRSPRNVKRLSTERRSTGGVGAGVGHLRSASSSSSISHDGGGGGFGGGKYFTLPGHGVSHASSVDSLTAATLMRTSRPSSARSTNLHRTKSAAERLLSGSHGNLSSQGPDQIKRIQREINQNRRRTLTASDMNRRQSPRYFHTDQQIGTDVQMAIKHHRMPKVLQRAKREMHRSETEKPPKRDGLDISPLGYDGDSPPSHYDFVDGGEEMEDGGFSPHREEDLEPVELEVDLNVTHQLITPDKVAIPDRYVEYEDVVLDPLQERVKRRKIRAIEEMLARSGQQASRPSVHLAAALAAEAGSAARAVAFQAQNKAIEPSLV